LSSGSPTISSVCRSHMFSLSQTAASNTVVIIQIEVSGYGTDDIAPGYGNISGF